MRWKTIIALGLPAAAALVVYLGTLGTGFIYDDHLQIEDNPWVKQLRYLPTVVSEPVWGFRTQGPTNYYRPVQMGLYNLLWSVADGDPLPFHLMNVLLHVAATWTLALLVLSLTREWRAACAVALLFAVHPVNTETVAWIACLPELGYCLCVLLALLLHTSGRNADSRHSRAFRGAALLSAALAMLFKETGLVVIPLIFLLELWALPRAARTVRQALIDSFRATVPYAAAGLIYFSLRLFVVGGVAPKGQFGYTALDALLNAPPLFFGYLRVLLFPLNLVAFHVFDPLPSALHPAFLVGLPALLLVPIALLGLSRYRPDLAFAGALVCLPLLPVLYVPALGANVFAERYAYLPSAGVAWLFFAAIAAVAARVVAPRRAATVALVVAVLLALPLSYRALDRNAVWRDDETLALTTLEADPRVWTMSAMLGSLYAQQGNIDEAIAIYDRALSLDPGNQILIVNRLGLLLRVGRIGADDAVEQFEKLAEERMSFEAWGMIGDAHLQARRFDAAEAAFRRALELNPWDEMLYNRLAVVYVETGRVEDGRAALRKALELDPGFRLARENLEILERLPAAQQK